VVERCKENARQITFVGVQNVDEAIAAARVQDVDFVLLDLRCGLRREQKENLNMEDEVSDARAEQCFCAPTAYATHTKEYHACVLQRTKTLFSK
jgi:ActR/RegA family two-component response regulator